MTDLSIIGFPDYTLYFDEEGHPAIWSDKIHNLSGEMTGWMKEKKPNLDIWK